MQLCSPSSGGCVSHLAACSESLTVCLATCSSGPEQSLVGGGGVSQPVGGAEAESLRETESNLQSPASIGRYPMEWLLAIDESRRSANMKRCYVCGTWTRNPIRSPTHKDCPHSACCLKCLFPMERAYVALKHEMQEMDKSLEVQSTRRPPRADASQVPHSLDAPEPRLCNELCVADNLIAVYGSDAAHADKIDSKIKAEDHKKDDKKENDKKRLSNEMEQPEQPELPNEESDGDSVTEPESSAEAAQRTVSSTQLLPPINPESCQWGVVTIKNIITLCAKHKLDIEKWPGCDVRARNRVSSIMAQELQWSSNQLGSWYSSVNILWDLVLGQAACRSHTTIGHWISRKTKIVGILPLHLFREMQRETARNRSVLWAATKELFTLHEAKRRSYPQNVPESYNVSQKPLLLEVHAEGSPHDCLTWLQRTGRYDWFTKVPDTFRSEEITRWATHK